MGSSTPLTRDHFTPFETAFGQDPLGSPAALKKRQDEGETGRFRKFTRDWIAQRDDSLDSAESSPDLPEPSVLAASAMVEMEAIMADLQGILAELGEDVEEVAA